MPPSSATSPRQIALREADLRLAEGAPDKARAALMRILPRAPRDPHVLVRLATACLMLRQEDQARFYAQAAGATDEPAILARLAAIFGALGDAEPALAAARHALALDPRNVELRAGAANLLIDIGRYFDALDMLDQGLAIDPSALPLRMIRAAAEFTIARPAGPAALYRERADAAPHDVVSLEMYASVVNYLPAATPADILDAHRRLGDELTRRAAGGLPPPPAPGPADADRPLSVGFVSQDFRTMSVAFFVEPVLERLPRDRFRVSCYSLHPDEDETSARFRALAAVYRHVPDAPAPALARLIRDDAIDILVDLSGHTHGSRMETFAYKPAPLQVSYCGYVHTTALPAVDARFVDSFTDPAPEADRWMHERLIRLDPCFLCYRPPAFLRDVPSAPPRDPAAPIVFGSFNLMSKLNPETIDLWARLLALVPGARLLIKNAVMRDPRARDELALAFSRRGIARDRLDMIPFTRSAAEHLALYHRVDIALDTFPYNGTTTTCEAMMMGVPVVSRAGPPGIHASRVGLSLNHAVGLPDLTADSEDSFLRIAAGLAADRPRLADLRRTLRGRMLDSPLCDESAMAERFGNALRTLWKETCRAA